VDKNVGERFSVRPIGGLPACVLWSSSQVGGLHVWIWEAMAAILVAESAMFRVAGGPMRRPADAICFRFALWRLRRLSI
jgi:hypothetical protein